MRKGRGRRYVWTLGLALALLAACSSPPAGLRVSPDEATLEPGGELELVVSGAPADDLVWTVRYGTIVVGEEGVRYRAPDFAVDDVVEAVRASDPRERAQVRLRVRVAGVLTPRIQTTSDLALVFTAAGEERTLSVVVYDVAGGPDPGAAVRFESEDPERIAVEATGPREARVRALSGEVGTVRIRIRGESAETYAWAVVAEAQPQARRLDPAWILDAVWDPDAAAWTRLELVRTPATEALSPGQVVYGGDRTGVWGRVRALTAAEERLRLELEPAALTEVFRNLDYVAERPTYALALDPAPSDRLRLAGPGGTERLLAPAACAGVEAGPETRGRLRVSVRAEVRIVEGRLERARWEAALAGELEHGAVTVATTGAGAPCTRTRWRADLPPLSGLLFPLRLQLNGALELEPEESDAAATLRLPPWRTRLRLAQKLKTPQALETLEEAAPELAEEAEPGLSFAEPGEAELTLSERLELRARAQVRGQVLADAPVLVWRQGLTLAAALEGALDPADAGYQGPDWRLEWRGGPVSGLAPYAALGLDAAPEPPVGNETARTLLRAPRVWGHLDTGGVRRIDLGTTGDEPAARFNFETEPPTRGEVEVWLRGGACEDAEACFSGPLARVAAVSFPDGPLFWRPAKEDRGVYQVFLRYRVGAVGRDLPYAARPPEPLLVVQGPDLQLLPVAVTLRGAPGGAAAGVLSYVNAPLAGVAPNGEAVQLSSPLRVWTPAEGRLLAEPRRLELAAGSRGYHRLKAACPKTPGVYEAELPVYTNDPDLPAVLLPATLVCDDEPAPEPFLQADRGAGAAPLEVRFTLGLRAPQAAEFACRLDFGDGSPPQVWPACPEKARVAHVYERPGRYQAALLVGGADAPVNLAFVFLQAD